MNVFTGLGRCLSRVSEDDDVDAGKKHSSLQMMIQEVVLQYVPTDVIGLHDDMSIQLIRTDYSQLAPSGACAVVIFILVPNCIAERTTEYSAPNMALHQRRAANTILARTIAEP